MSRVQAILVAAGGSTRMGRTPVRKPWLALAGRTVADHAVEALLADPRVEGISVVVHADDLERARLWAEDGAHAGRLRIVEGGASRMASVARGIAAAPTCELLCVHDAARPCLGAGALARVLDAAEEHGAALLALEVRDTLKRADENGRSVETVDRAGLWLAQTPQVFRASTYRELARRALEQGEEPTDDAALWEAHAGKPRLVRGEPTNLKITFEDDLALAEAILRARGATTENAMMKEAPVTNLRVGTGFDVHRLVEGRPCMLGGIELPHPTGPAGHSDGDAVLHALGDALLGAAGLDDLGTLFPDTDEAAAGTASSEYLRAIVGAVHGAGWRVANVDLVIATEGPRIAPHRAEMRASIARLLEVAPERVNLKGKSVEGLGALAGGTGVSVHAVCLLEGRS